VPDTVVRGVTVATVAAVAATGGAVAVAGSIGPAPDARIAAASLTTGAVVPAAGRTVLTVPVPELVVPGAGTPPPAVLDPTALSRAVARAQADARRIAAQTRETTPVETPAAETPAEDTGTESDDQDAREQEDERTAERARRAGHAADPEATATQTRGCGLDESQLGRVKPQARAAAEFLGCAFGEPTVLGVAGRANASDHPKGLAVDFMVDRATGDKLAACAIRDREALGINYVIWRQRIDTGSGFRAMPDRGGPTANHFDHVHISFEPGAAPGAPAAC
jgi:hypothetical protein